jgi:hypothetical protein
MRIRVWRHNNRTASFILAKIRTSDTRRWYPRTLWLWSGSTCTSFGLASLQCRIFCLFKMSVMWLDPVRITSGCSFTKVKNCSQKALLEAQSLTVLAQCVTCRGENVKQNEVSIHRSDLLDVEGNWMAATDRGSCCFGVCWCPHSSDCATGLRLETSLVIRNPSVSPKFKTLSEYSLRCYYWLVIFSKRLHGELTMYSRTLTHAK